MKRLVNRILIGLLLSIPLALAAYAYAHASPPGQDISPDRPDCQECHQQYHKAWEVSVHGQALTEPEFAAAWQSQGKPKECLGCHTTGYNPATGQYQAEGVTCAACHDPVPVNHPLAPASMSRSAKACGECHRDTAFEWQNSRHGQSELTCISCHDPHATSLRAKDTATLCAACHGTRVAAYGHSQHAAEGLTCTDCHISETHGMPGLGNAQHSHSFEVNLNTCTQCHRYEIHNAAAAMLVAESGEPARTPTPQASLNSGHPATVSAEPQPVGPLGFAVFAGLIGLACGIVLAPWLERGFRRLANDKAREVENDYR
jgi:predicted CXXCH cytochrome family protein